MKINDLVKPTTDDPVRTEGKVIRLHDNRKFVSVIWLLDDGGWLVQSEKKTELVVIK